MLFHNCDGCRTRCAPHLFAHAAVSGDIAWPCCTRIPTTHYPPYPGTRVRHRPALPVRHPLRVTHSDPPGPSLGRPLAQGLLAREQHGKRDVPPPAGATSPERTKEEREEEEGPSVDGWRAAPCGGEPPVPDRTGAVGARAGARGGSTLHSCPLAAALLLFLLPRFTPSRALALVASQPSRSPSYPPPPFTRYVRLCVVLLPSSFFLRTTPIST